MPPSSPASGGTFRRVFVIAACIAVLGLGACGFVELGPFLAQEDPLQKADAIVVLSGTPMRRPLEGADLYLAGYSPRIVLSRDTPEGGALALAERGIAFPHDVDRAREVLIQLGIPDDAIVIPQRIHDSTAAESVTLRELAQAHGWRRVIIVSSGYHLRRAAYAFRRELSGTGVEISMRATRYEEVEPDRWWRHRRDIREIVTEVPRLIAYVLGLGA